MGTVLKDDPQLNVRGVETPRQPRKAVVDGGFAIPETARLFDGAEVIVFTAREDAAKARRRNSATRASFACRARRPARWTCPP